MRYDTDHWNGERPTAASVARRLGRFVVGVTEVGLGLALGALGTVHTGGLSWLAAAPVITSGALRLGRARWDDMEDAPAPVRVAEHIAALRPVKVALGVAEMFGAGAFIGVIPHFVETSVELALAYGSITSTIAGMADGFIALMGYDRESMPVRTQEDSY